MEKISPNTMLLLAQTPTKKILQRQIRNIFLDITTKDEETFSYSCAFVTENMAKDFEKKMVETLNY